MATAYTPPPEVAMPPAALTPAVTVSASKVYRLQVGSYKVARNAVDAFDKLKSAGLSPAYERNGEYFRVVLAGIKGAEVQTVAERLGAAGFREALIREER
jgi:rare lipoprotein A